MRAIEAEFGRIPTIFITATPENCDGCPPDRILPKPFSTAALLGLFAQIAPTASAP